MSDTESPNPVYAERDGAAGHEATTLTTPAEEGGTATAAVTRGARAERARRRRRRATVEGVRHTRISGAWSALVVALVLGVALVDFIVENTRSVRVDFFSAGGRLPVAVALLAAALAGAAVVLTVGVCRTAQLRLAIRHRGRLASATALVAAENDDHRSRV